MQYSYKTFDLEFILKNSLKTRELCREERRQDA